MKLTKNGINMKEFKRQRKSALKGCHRCPACGAIGRWNIMEDVRHNPDNTTMKTQFYCLKCRAEWESEPYPNYDSCRKNV